MRFYFVSLFSLCVLCSQPVRGQHSVIKTAVCEIAARPEQFDGKFVQVRATVVSGFEVFAIRDPQQDCGTLWLTYPGGRPAAVTTLGAASPNIERSPVILQRDAHFAEFERKLAAEMHPKTRGSLCIACSRYEVTATLLGRVDYAGKNGGFGHLNGYRQQFVLQSVSEIYAKDLSTKYNPSEYSSKPVRFPTGYIVGRVLDPDGRPVSGAEVVATSVEEVPLYLRDVTAQTEDKGQFKLEVPPGKYVVGINIKDPPAARFPYPPTYYPQSLDRQDARVFVMVDHKSEKIELKLTKKLSPKTIRVHVSWPDGTPTPNANVWLCEEGAPSRAVGHSVSHTDAEGNFDLQGFEGIAYIVHANIYKKPGYVPYCAESTHLKIGPEYNERISFVLTVTGDVCRSRGR